ncbi:AAA family ATPase [Vibrio atlanticus]|uniref:AAA family ATPase n=1 Tax=Vibrio atlanticus TaxID=693153 RepID=UPI0022AF57B4|nr:AAA family ATPase [Vibrio atlanticus]MCZ4309898.1 AAA family ATPase [Vibrio atlanticus]
MLGRINELTITGFKNRFSTMTVKFTEHNVSVIYGDNGCGKTTLLDIIHAVFTCDNQILARNQVDNVRVSYTVIKDDRLINRRVIIKRNKQSDEYRWPESHLSQFSSLGLGVGRTMVSTEMPIKASDVYKFIHAKKRDYDFISDQLDFEDLYDFSDSLVRHIKRNRSLNAIRSANHRRFDAENLYLKHVKIEEVIQMLLENYRVARIRSSERVQNALFEALSGLVFNKFPEKDIAEEEKEILYRELIDNKERIIKALELRDENLTKKEFISRLKSITDYSSFNDVVNSPMLFKLFDSMVSELSMEKSLINSINEIVSVFNSHMPPNKHLVIDEDKVEVFVGFDTHPISELSSGETQLLTTLCLLVLKGRDKNVILIDEPELSFNIKWQRKFVDLVTLLVPKAQVIVASHSPSIAGSSKYKTEMYIELGGAL